MRDKITMMKLSHFFTKTILYDFLGKRSYSQSGEDMVVRAMIDDRRDGYFVDIGAYHPKQFSNTYYFYKRGWRGINVEPNRELIKLFDEVRGGDLNLQLAIGKRKGFLNYFYRTEATRNSLSDGADVVRKEKVSVVTMKWLLDQYLPKDRKIDLLSVDTEGYDMEVLWSNDWDKYSPEIIIVEDAEGRFMKSKGYVLAGKTSYSEIWKKKK